jgi:ABC-type transport system substrate-binding protein
MKHKSIIWSLILIFMLALSACGGSAPALAPAPAEESQPAEEEAAPTQEAAVEEAAIEAPTEESAQAAVPNVLKVAATANVTTWDPVKSFSTEALYMANIYEQLLRVNPPGPQNLSPPSG